MHLPGWMLSCKTTRKEGRGGKKLFAGAEGKKIKVSSGAIKIQNGEQQQKDRKEENPSVFFFLTLRRLHSGQKPAHTVPPNMPVGSMPFEHKNSQFRFCCLFQTTTESLAPSNLWVQDQLSFRRDAFLFELGSHLADEGRHVRAEGHRRLKALQFERSPRMRPRS